MATPTWITLANANQTSQTTTGAAYATSASLTDVSPGANTLGQAFQIQSEQLYPGQMLRFTAAGIYSVTSSPTLAFGVFYGGVAGVTLASTAAVTTTSGASNAIWLLSATSRVLTAGTSGTAVTSGIIQGLPSPIASGSVNISTLMPATSSTGGQATIDTSIAKIITVGAQWGTNSSLNTLTCYQWAVEYLTEP